MIIEPIEVTEYGVTFNRLTHNAPFYVCGHEEGSNLIVLMSLSEDTPEKANAIINSKLTGFGTTSYQELLDEIEVRGLVLPN